VRVLSIVLLAACGRGGFDPVDGADGTTPPDLTHVQLATGWSVSVFHDFSQEHPYNDTEFPDPPELYSNAPVKAFTLSLPYPQAIGVCAGRDILVITATGIEIHYYGMHPPNDMNLPDGINGAVWTNPRLLVTSTSSMGGDGVFWIAGDWTISPIVNPNNTRDITFDAAGGFDSVGVGQPYYGDMTGVYLLGPPSVLIVPSGDAASLHVAGDVLLFTDRHTDVDSDLVSVASGTHATTVLATASAIQLADGDATAPALGWATIDNKQLVEVIPGSAPFEAIAETTDPLYTWMGAAIPPPSHPLGTPWPSIYLIESNRALGIDRLLRFTMP
jgi:hypothetical protein